MPNTGKIKQIIGPVVDVHFEGKLPEIYNALKLHVTMARNWSWKFSNTWVRTAFAPWQWTPQTAWYVAWL
ncbi:hypothetical protein [Chitinophaga sedimenti]|uniref:hypothetical protein n=1 Tax=Chitinophaga sedimenti TaxID=2033606 RepID=UPI00249F18F0|nr:hypothetical protein [Chitinophaga sedimenti]